MFLACFSEAHASSSSKNNERSWLQNTHFWARVRFKNERPLCGHNSPKRTKRRTPRGNRPVFTSKEREKVKKKKKKDWVQRIPIFLESLKTTPTKKPVAGRTLQSWLSDVEVESQPICSRPIYEQRPPTPRVPVRFLTTPWKSLNRGILRETSQFLLQMPF